MESCKLYDCMAVIIRYLLNENFEADMAYAVASNHEKNMLEEAEELLEEGFSLTDFSILSDTYKSNLVMLPFLLQKLDEKAAKLLEEELWIERLDFLLQDVGHDHIPVEYIHFFLAHWKPLLDFF